MKIPDVTITVELQDGPPEERFRWMGTLTWTFVEGVDDPAEEARGFRVLEDRLRNWWGERTDQVGQVDMRDRKLTVQGFAVDENSALDVAYRAVKELQAMTENLL